MLFQTLDDKDQCIAIYLNGEITDELPDDLSKTWNYSAFLKDREIEYAKIYCGGKPLGDVCPENLKEEWNKISNRMMAYHRSFT